ncbi:hypothetical protein TNCV_4043571 [Trichonephila clavipes]|nr:hypothetical protein TNCV_4043571 [Trichonephila clavipes]
MVKIRTEIAVSPPHSSNRCHGEEVASGRKRERGHYGTCAISVKILDDCPPLRGVDFPPHPFPPEHAKEAKPLFEFLKRNLNLAMDTDARE